jgi:peptidoglycan hydrolase-like protein with peptidoglycan-binding domain
MTSQRPILRRGDGIRTPNLRNDVKQLQTLLKNANILPNNSPIDGLFGVQTETAVKRFQSNHRLVTDGIVGRNTWSALAAYSTAKPPNPSPVSNPSNSQINNNTVANIPPNSQANQTVISRNKPTLRRGDGLYIRHLQNDVKYLQTLLKEVKYFPPNALIDGFFDQQTEAAVIGFQRRNDLDVTGVVQQSTWNALEAQAGRSNSPNSNQNTPVISVSNSPEPTLPPLVLNNKPKPTLRKGDGINLPQLKEDVKLLQDVLKRLGFLPANAHLDGLFGDQTETAVKNYQAQKRLLANGIVDRVTWSVLERDLLAQNKPQNPSGTTTPATNNQVNPNPNPNPRYPSLRRGDGLDFPELRDQVRNLQQLLKNQGFLNGAVDGLFGSGTENAVKQFQRSKKLTVDGLVGANTWEALLNQSVTVYDPNRSSTSSPKAQRIVNSISNATIRRYAANSVPIILKECDASNVSDRGQIAYILATAQHESHLGQWMVEFASGQAYEGRRDLGNTQRGDGVRYKGRGFVQITGRRNYTDWSRRLGVDLVGNPQMATQPDIAAKILVRGMRDGTFTGRRLSEFISGNTQDFYNARRIVNGLDRASHIANIARNFLRVV